MARGPLTARRGWAGAAVLAALVLAALAPLPGGPSRALAHASYERSEPAFAAELTQPPRRIDIWFSQQLFRQQGANTFLLRDINPALAEPHTPAAEVGVIASGELTLDNDDRFHAFAVLHVELPEGRYRVEWTSLSADDGDDSKRPFRLLRRARGDRRRGRGGPRARRRVARPLPRRRDGRRRDRCAATPAPRRRCARRRRSRDWTQPCLRSRPPASSPSWGWSCRVVAGGRR